MSGYKKKTSGADPPAASNEEPVLLEKDVPISRSLLCNCSATPASSVDFIHGPRICCPNSSPTILSLPKCMPVSFLVYLRLPPFRRKALSAGVGSESIAHFSGSARRAGKFSFLSLRHLEELLRSRDISPAILRYCMSDCSHGLTRGVAITATPLAQGPNGELNTVRPLQECWRAYLSSH